MHVYACRGQHGFLQLKCPTTSSTHGGTCSQTLIIPVVEAFFENACLPLRALALLELLQCLRLVVCKAAYIAICWHFFHCHILLQAPAASDHAKAASGQAKAAKARAPRMQQGNMNRWVHLAVLHEMGMHQEASQHIQQVRSRSKYIDQLFQQHWWNIYQYDRDTRFGDL